MQINERTHSTHPKQQNQNEKINKNKIQHHRIHSYILQSRAQIFNCYHTKHDILAIFSLELDVKLSIFSNTTNKRQWKNILLLFIPNSIYNIDTHTHEHCMHSMCIVQTLYTLININPCWARRWTQTNQIKSTRNSTAAAPILPIDTNTTHTHTHIQIIQNVFYRI